MPTGIKVNCPVSEFKAFYKNHTRKETAQHFSVSVSLIDKWCKKYLSEEEYQTHECKSKQRVYFKVENGEYVGVEIDGVYYTRAYFDKLYNVEMETRSSLEKMFNISTIDTILKKLKIYREEGYKKDTAFLEKRKKNNLEKYGVEYPTQLQSVKQKTRETCLERYGVEHSTQAIQMKEKSTQTMLKRYGVEHALQNEEILDNLKKKNIDKYGVEYPMLLPESKKKAIDTNIKKYGVSNPFASEEIKKKIKEKNQALYGVDFFKQKNIQNIEIWNDKDKFVEFLRSFDRKVQVIEIGKFFNCGSSAVQKKIHEYECEELVFWIGNRSQYEDEIASWLSEEFNFSTEEISLNCKGLLPGREEIDIYIPSKKFGIEFNGDYWHSDLQEKFQDHNGRSTKHQEKSLAAEKNGITLFQIFEFEWNQENLKEKIKSRIRNILKSVENKIPARKCSVVVLTKDEKKIFLDANHVQGNDRSTLQFGLMYNNELVACMTFVAPKNKKFTWELSRFCTKKNMIVQGGASKLLKKFTSTLQKGNTIVSYNDITKTTGNVYKILGFKCVSINAPNYIWENFATGDIRTRYQEQAAGEVERMHNAGYHRVCDCGTKTWVYTIDK